MERAKETAGHLKERGERERVTQLRIDKVEAERERPISKEKGACLAPK